MPQCPSCQSELPEGIRFCPSCGARLGSPSLTEQTISMQETELTPPTPSGPRARSSPTSSTATTPSDDLFPPGALVADRYRIVALLGKGGMGEVYRADDLTLGHSVALKFLPDELASRPDRRERFLSEVRTARQVAHPNVCRVYDIGDIEGHPFLSMEFVDGEDLSSLLRRIGRLPHEKAVEIARQLCAGLAALHDRGVLHRDLKPANVMIDGRGGVRITDFGLSGLADEIPGTDVRAGTPAYMSPEQLSGRGVDRRSDIYALGLVLYEVFTGRRAFEADSVAELGRLHAEETPVSASSVVPDVDPVVERVIERCLEKDPDRRPSSAVVVAAALPGGDPLAAALAAGEIPSLEMVVAAGEKGGVRPIVGTACFVAVIAGVVLAATFNTRDKLYRWDPLEKPTQVLVDRARNVLSLAARDEPFEDSAHGFLPDGRVIRYVRERSDSPDRWNALRDARPPALFFWYRQSPEELVGLDPDGAVTPHDPSPVVPGMSEVRLDSRGRLLSLLVVTAETDGEVEPRPAPDWRSLFAEAGLDPGAFTESAPEWTPRVYADARRAWVGTSPEDPGTELRVEAASHRGLPVSFEVIGPWRQPAHLHPDEDELADEILKVLILSVFLAVLAGAVALAVRNVRLGRGDQKGATRLSVFLFLVMMAGWLLTAHHVGEMGAEIDKLLRAVSHGLLSSGLLFCFYLALEPYVRKAWSDQIVAWSRLLTGRLRDPLVGRDILVGGVFFVFITLLDALRLTDPELGKPIGAFVSTRWATLLGPSHVLGTTLSLLANAVFYSLFILLFLLFLRILCRSPKAAIAVFTAVVAFVVAFLPGSSHRALAAAAGILLALGWSFVLFRFGFFPFMVGMFFDQLVSRFPITLDAGRWFAGAGWWAMLVVLGITAYGLHTALAGKRLFRDELLGG